MSADGEVSGKARIERHLWDLFEAAMAAKAFAPALKALLAGARQQVTGGNTTLVVVATNAKLIGE